LELQLGVAECRCEKRPRAAKIRQHFWTFANDDKFPLRTSSFSLVASIFGV
jgi:hypothetical protein